jgi:hypothetical protein
VMLFLFADLQCFESDGALNLRPPLRDAFCGSIFTICFGDVRTD